MSTHDDRVAVEDVLYAYADLVDRARLDELMELFTTDAVLDYGHGRVFEGRETMRGLFADRLLAVYSATSHHISNVRIELEGNRAHASCHVYAWHERADDSSHPQVWGRYHDDLIRNAGTWRIARRVIRAAGEEGFPTPEGLPSAFEPIDRTSS